ncbi:MAG: hypothetical protein KDB36_13340 [Acidimicrobiales bacterium]|nr:hypothetical protein [Acidimicrobiales bacterium]
MSGEEATPTTYPSVDEIRTMQAQRVRSLSEYPDEALEGLRAEIIDIAERYRRVAYTTRSGTASWSRAEVAHRLVLPWLFVQSIDEVRVDGEVWDGVLGADLEAGVVWGVPTGGDLEIDATYGMVHTPAAVRRLVALFVARQAVADAKASADNAYLLVTPDGGTERRGTADWEAGRPTGWLDVDTALNALEDHRGEDLL